MWFSKMGKGNWSSTMSLPKAYYKTSGFHNDGKKDVTLKWKQQRRHQSRDLNCKSHFK